MTTIAHTLSSSYIAYFATLGFNAPVNQNLILTAFIAPAILDLDHVTYLLMTKKPILEQAEKGQLHRARTIFHELLGVAIFGIITLATSFFYPIFAKILFISLLIHITQDMVVGKSFPYNPVKKMLIHLFNFSFKTKAVIDITISIIFLALWILYLNVIPS